MKHPFNPADYRGVIANAAYRAVKSRVMRGASFLPVGQDVDKWNACVNVVDDQGRTSACESASFANILEVLIRLFVSYAAFAPNLQIDYPRLHKLAQTLRYPGQPYDPNKGLFMGDSFKAAKIAGLVPQDAEEVEVDFSVDSMREALLECPIHTGIEVPPTFGVPNPRTGEIPRCQVANAGNGHAMQIVRMFGAENTRMPLYALPNTWGTEWAWQGVCIIDHDFLEALLLDAPRIYRFDYTWLAHNREWENWLMAA